MRTTSGAVSVAFLGVASLSLDMALHCCLKHYNTHFVGVLLYIHGKLVKIQGGEYALGIIM